MQRLLIWLIVTAAALWIAIILVPGISLVGVSPGALPDVGTLGNLALVAVILGLMNAVVRPILKTFTFPITCLTLGLFTFVINALMLFLTAWVAQQLDLGFVVDGPVAALLGAIVISVVSTVLSVIVRD
jgi:putative membrane protein